MLRWVYYLAHLGLIGVVLENVIGINQMARLARGAAREPVMAMFIRVLDTYLPFFAWSVETLALKNYMCPQSRLGF